MDRWTQKIATTGAAQPPGARGFERSTATSSRSCAWPVKHSLFVCICQSWPFHIKLLEKKHLDHQPTAVSIPPLNAFFSPSFLYIPGELANERVMRLYWLHCSSLEYIMCGIFGYCSYLKEKVSSWFLSSHRAGSVGVLMSARAGIRYHQLTSILYASSIWRCMMSLPTPND